MAGGPMAESRPELPRRARYETMQCVLTRAGNATGHIRLNILPWAGSRGDGHGNSRCRACSLGMVRTLGARIWVSWRTSRRSWPQRAIWDSGSSTGAMPHACRHARAIQSVSARRVLSLVAWQNRYHGHCSGEAVPLGIRAPIQTLLPSDRRTEHSVGP